MIVRRSVVTEKEVELMRLARASGKTFSVSHSLKFKLGAEKKGDVRVAFGGNRKAPEKLSQMNQKIGLCLERFYFSLAVVERELSAEYARELEKNAVEGIRG